MYDDDDSFLPAKYRVKDSRVQKIYFYASDIEHFYSLLLQQVAQRMN